MNQKIYADLHNHTIASDGDFTPAGLVKEAESLGIKAIAITDHDTLNGLKEAVAAGKKCHVEVIPGVEVSIRFKRSFFTGTLHMLCYFKTQSLMDDKFVRHFQNILSRGRGKNLVKARVDEINKIFGPGREFSLLKRDLLYEDITALSHNATRRHFALALKEHFNIMDRDTINLIIGNNSRAYIPSGIKLGEVAEFIRENNIFAVLAHPAAGSFPGQGHYREVLPRLNIVEKIFPEFLAAGIRGLEVYYPGHTKAHQDLMSAWADTHHLIKTGGSDCHDGLERPLGVNGICELEYNLFKSALA